MCFRKDNCIYLEKKKCSAVIHAFVQFQVDSDSCKTQPTNIQFSPKQSVYSNIVNMLHTFFVCSHISEAVSWQWNSTAFIRARHSFCVHVWCYKCVCVRKCLFQYVCCYVQMNTFIQFCAIFLFRLSIEWRVFSLFVNKRIDSLYR